MKKNSPLYSNPYSKYKYTNNGTVKYMVDPYNYKTTMHGVELKAHKDKFKAQLEDMESHLNVGNTWVINNVYKCTQINNVDQPLNPQKGATFFRLFRLK